jgi:hypothetical protein
MDTNENSDSSNGRDPTHRQPAGKPKGWQHADVMRRRSAALKMRLRGHDHATIAARLGFDDRSGVWKNVRAALDEMVHEPAEAVRELELACLDKLLCQIWPLAFGRPGTSPT